MKHKIKIIVFIFLMIIISYIVYTPELNNKICYVYKNKQIEKKIFTDIRVKWLKDILNKALQIKDYQAHDDLTFCNVFARDILDNRPHPIWEGYGFYIDNFSLDIKNVFPTPFSVLSMSIKDAWIKADRAWKEKKIERLTIRRAQEEANNGYIIWVISLRWSHEAIVYPGEYDEEMGCWIVQAGGKGCSGIMKIFDPCAFGWRKTDIRFYKFNWRKA